MKAAVCLIARDEERDIGEWLAFQFAVGFDAVIVYDNASTDRTPDIVRAFGRHFDVRLKNWPRTDPLTQHAAYNDCLSRFGSEFDWIAFLDADELLVPRQGGVQELLEVQKSDATAVALNWRMFGSSGHQTRPPGLLMEAFTRRSSVDDALGVTKCIVRTGRPTSTWSAHYFLITEVSAAIARPAASMSRGFFLGSRRPRSTPSRRSSTTIRKLVLNGGARLVGSTGTAFTSGDLKISTPTTATSLRTARRCGSYPRCMVSLTERFMPATSSRRIAIRELV